MSAPLGDPGLYRLAADRTGQAAEQFTLDRAAERLRGYLADAVPPPRGGPGGLGSGQPPKRGRFRGVAPPG